MGYPRRRITEFVSHRHQLANRCRPYRSNVNFLSRSSSKGHIFVTVSVDRWGCVVMALNGSCLSRPQLFKRKFVRSSASTCKFCGASVSSCQFLSSFRLGFATVHFYRRLFEMLSRSSQLFMSEVLKNRIVEHRKLSRHVALLAMTRKIKTKPRCANARRASENSCMVRMGVRTRGKIGKCVRRVTKLRKDDATAGRTCAYAYASSKMYARFRIDGHVRTRNANTDANFRRFQDCGGRTRVRLHFDEMKNTILKKCGTCRGVVHVLWRPYEITKKFERSRGVSSVVLQKLSSHHRNVVVTVIQM